MTQEYYVLLENQKQSSHWGTNPHYIYVQTLFRISESNTLREVQQESAFFCIFWRFLIAAWAVSLFYEQALVEGVVKLEREFLNERPSLSDSLMVVRVIV